MSSNEGVYRVVERLYAVQVNSAGGIDGGMVLEPGTLVRVTAPEADGLLPVLAGDKSLLVVYKLFLERCSGVSAGKSPQMPPEKE